MHIKQEGTAMPQTDRVSALVCRARQDFEQLYCHSFCRKSGSFYTDKITLHAFSHDTSSFDVIKLVSIQDSANTCYVNTF